MLNGCHLLARKSMNSRESSEPHAEVLKEVNRPVVAKPYIIIVVLPDAACELASVGAACVMNLSVVHCRTTRSGSCPLGCIDAGQLFLAVRNPLQLLLE